MNHTLTQLEANVLNQLADEHWKGQFMDDGMGELFGTEWAHVDTYIPAKDISGDMKVIRGVLSSLIKKGLVRSCEADGPDLFFISKIAYNLIKK